MSFVFPVGVILSPLLRKTQKHVDHIAMQSSHWAMQLTRLALNEQTVFYFLKLLGILSMEAACSTNFKAANLEKQNCTSFVLSITLLTVCSQLFY